jgi:two-component sensor histidine kinase
LTESSHNFVAKTFAPLRRRSLILFVLAWTAFVLIAIYWLLRGNSGPTVWMVNEAHPPSPGAVESMQRWFKTELGLVRFYPWLLLGPYAALVAYRFPLQRDRILLHLPINIAMCVVFLIACRELAARTGGIGAKIIIINRSQGPHTNDTDEASTTNRAAIVRREIHQEIGVAGSAADPWEGPFRIESGFSDANLSNVTVQFHQGFGTPPLSGLPKMGIWPTAIDLLAYGAIVGLAHSIYFYRRFREREHRALALESNLAHARLNALKAQLQPHFLFNSLNAAVAMLRRNPAGAEATLVSLSELLRLALSHSERQEISVQEELEFVQRYVELQKTRFGDKLEYREQIDDSARDCLLPTLTLQPLVENAIRHGIEPADKPGTVILSVRRADERLLLSVEDNGVGLNGSSTSGGAGIGLKNLRARLQTLYGSSHKLEIGSRNGDGRGVLVSLEIPLRTISNAGHSPDSTAS